MRDGGTALLHRVRPTGELQTPVGRQSQATCWCRSRLWMVVLLVMVIGLESRPSHAEDARPIRIGALTDAWGATPHIMGLRDGLAELGYQANQDFFLGIRFTRGNRDLLPAAARELVQAGADLLFVDSIVTAQAAQQAASRAFRKYVISLADPSLSN